MPAPEWNGMRFHFLRGRIAFGPGDPAWGEVEVRCAATTSLIRRFRLDVLTAPARDVDLSFHANSTDNYELLFYLTSAREEEAVVHAEARP